MTDVGTIVLMAIAVPLLVLVSATFPMVVREHREWRRRQRLTPMQRALEDMGVAARNLAVAMSNTLAPVISGLAVTMNGLAAALNTPTPPPSRTMGAERKEPSWPSSR